jgi:hypothetical protein
MNLKNVDEIKSKFMGLINKQVSRCCKFKKIIHKCTFLHSRFRIVFLYKQCPMSGINSLIK